MMSKMIQAYFHTENEAEDARISLLKYDPELLEVGSLEAGYSGEGRLLIPLIAGAGSVGGSGINNGVGIVGSYGAVASLLGDDVSIHDPAYTDEFKEEDLKDLHYVLSAKVKEADYSEAVSLLRHNHGHLEKLD
ncbi:hypothetical protein [Paenibacillus sp. N3.4]|uniref:hypothetical protein n=1 Tax=Paenibacillus sp. N3.4 TaxID=2603222 RepID=UPI0011CB0791|nr:hypothetical protein [Paenibacillus sp. N3.4]TXK83718.1 hypothetical protein FU659_12445 [Paenibacillus sp. N3.4]